LSTAATKADTAVFEAETERDANRLRLENCHLLPAAYFRNSRPAGHNRIVSLAIGSASVAQPRFMKHVGNHAATPWQETLTTVPGNHDFDRVSRCQGPLIGRLSGRPNEPIPHKMKDFP